MPLPPSLRVRSCLGCIPLRTGCIVLGCSVFVLGMLEICQHIKYLVDIELSYQQCLRKEGDTVPAGGLDVDNITLTKGRMVDFEEEHEDEDDRTHKNDCLPERLSLGRFIFGFSTFVSSIYVFMTVMMLYGVLKKKPRMMIPWMVWIVAQVFFSLITLFGVGSGQTVSVIAFSDIVLNIYFILVVTSYYTELREAEERHTGVTVVAVTNTPNEMMVVIPTYPKDNPPPYPGFTSAINPAYNPNGTGLPMYSATQYPTLSPPGFQSVDPSQNQQVVNSPVPAFNTNYNMSPPPGYSNGSGEAVPLVEKPPLPNN